MSAQTPQQASPTYGRGAATPCNQCMELHQAQNAGTHVKTSAIVGLAVYHQVQGLCSGGGWGRMRGNGGFSRSACKHGGGHRNLTGEMPLAIAAGKCRKIAGR